MFHKIGVYDAFHGLAEARKHYRRCRRPQCFKLANETVKRIDPVCAGCGKRFSEHNRTANADLPESMQFQHSESEMLANHCWYDPGTKKIAIMQYHCSWVSVLTAVFRRRERMM